MLGTLTLALCGRVRIFTSKTGASIEKHTHTHTHAHTHTHTHTHTLEYTQDYDQSKHTNFVFNI
jgi:hypothetical protein